MKAGNDEHSGTGLSRFRMFDAGVLAGPALAGFAIFASYALLMMFQGSLVGFSGEPAGKDSVLSFGSDRAPAATRYLSGVSGEALSIENTPAAALVHLARNDEQNGEISSLALDRISAGDCITVTTASGQKLSFQIMGARVRDDKANVDASSKIDLSVTACAHNSEAIAKAVIESKTDAPVSVGPLPRSL